MSLIENKEELDSHILKILERKQEKANFCNLSPNLSQVEKQLHLVFNRILLLSKENKTTTSHPNLLKFASCRYSIEDCQSVIDDYKKIEWKKTTYLPLYGLLQALFSQIEAMRTLNQILFSKKLELNLYLGMSKTRTIRNKVLHATDIGYGKKNESYMIVQILLSKQQFTLIKKTDTTNTQTIIEEGREEGRIDIIDIYDMIVNHENDVLKILHIFANDSYSIDLNLVQKNRLKFRNNFIKNNQ